MLPEAHVEFGSCSSISHATAVRSEQYIYPSDVAGQSWIVQYIFFDVALQPGPLLCHLIECSVHQTMCSRVTENQSLDISSDVTLINGNLEIIRNSTAHLAGMNTTVTTWCELSCDVNYFVILFAMSSLHTWNILTRYNCLYWRSFSWR